MNKRTLSCIDALTPLLPLQHQYLSNQLCAVNYLNHYYKWACNIQLSKTYPDFSFDAFYFKIYRNTGSSIVKSNDFWKLQHNQLNLDNAKYSYHNDDFRLQNIWILSIISSPYISRLRIARMMWFISENNFFIQKYAYISFKSRMWITSSTDTNGKKLACVYITKTLTAWI